MVMCPTSTPGHIMTGIDPPVAGRSAKVVAVGSDREGDRVRHNQWCSGAVASHAVDDGERQWGRPEDYRPLGSTFETMGPTSNGLRKDVGGSASGATA